MRKVLLSALAAVLIAAGLLFAPTPASAQFRPYPHRPQLGFASFTPATNPFVYRDPVTPQLYNLSPGANFNTPNTRPLFTGRFMPAAYSYYWPYNYAYDRPVYNFRYDIWSGGLATAPPEYVDPDYYEPNAGFTPGTYLDTRPASYAVLSPSSGGDVLYASNPTLPGQKPGEGSPILPAGYTKDAPAKAPALVTVRVPSAGAEVWFQGSKTNRTGTEREFASPDLTPGESYTYQVRARWQDNGEDRDVTRTVRVRAGDKVTVDFTAGK